MDLPGVSIGVPTYNRPVLLAQALERLSRQTYPNLEIVVSDNASTDAAAVRAVVEDMARRDPRFRYVRQSENLGAIRNLKYLLDHARHEYFMWAADDDELEPTFVADLVAVLESDPECALAMSGYDVVDQMVEPPIQVSYLRHLRLLPNPDLYRRLRNYILQPEYYGKIRILWGLGRTKVMRRAFADTLATLKEGAPLKWHRLPIEMRILVHGNLAIVPKDLFHSRILPSSDGKAQSAVSVSGMVRMCRESFAAYHLVVRDAKITFRQKCLLRACLAWQELHAQARVAPYYCLNNLSPGLGRKIKSIWFKVLVNR